MEYEHDFHYEGREQREPVLLAALIAPSVSDNVVASVMLNKLMDKYLEFNGDTPLHYACSGQIAFNKMLSRSVHDAIHQRSSSGVTPILCVTLHEENLTQNPKETIKLTQYLLEFDPSVACAIINDCYPLVRICTVPLNRTADLEVIKLLYDTYPQALISHGSHVGRLIELSRTCRCCHKLSAQSTRLRRPYA